MFKLAHVLVSNLSNMFMNMQKNHFYHNLKKKKINVNIFRKFVHHIFLLLTVSFAWSVPIKMQSKPKYFSGSSRTNGGGDGDNTIGILLLVQPILCLFYHVCT